MELLQTNPFGLTDVGNASSPAFVDIDADGDLDAFIGSLSGDIFYFANTGKATSPAFAAAQVNPFGLANSGSEPTFVDMDQDNDMDLFVGMGDGDISYIENVGSPTSPTFTTAKQAPFGLVNVGYGSSPTFVDINNDGQVEAFIGINAGLTFYFKSDSNNIYLPLVLK